MERAAHPEPEKRVIDRVEIAETLGVAADLSPTDRWPGGVRDRYLGLAASSDLVSVSTPLLESAAAQSVSGLVAIDGGGEVSVTELAARTPAVLSGRTGEGKSTGRPGTRPRRGASRTVLYTRAEVYLPGRLAALAADALSEVLREPMPSATGSQILADPDVVIVIDGVSEVSPSLRQALKEDVRVLVASGQGAGVVIVGRDVAALRAVLPQTSDPSRFTVSGLIIRAG